MEMGDHYDEELLWRFYNIDGSKCFSVDEDVLGEKMQQEIVDRIDWHAEDVNVDFEVTDDTVSVVIHYSLMPES
jgi:hypothetical protein